MSCVLTPPTRKVGQVLFHPTTANAIVSTSGEHTVKLWDLANPEDPRAVLGGHGDAIQSITFNHTGMLLATMCHDSLFDPHVRAVTRCMWRTRMAGSKGGVDG
ncbi:hypothetical protein DFH08DRAFT_972683 [Mycena albidolilacea]|uniref:Coronin n=1 Tax=Mycena albidolilacea TaxID=1033008 RepID=A0AAD7EEI1_9AGAR|nr:hypothetical protein DFH08DRAFT_972683 [Mycena albidolilacea]